MFSGNYGGYGSPLGQMFGGLFGNSGDPYKKGWEAYQPWAQKGIDVQNPFYQAGTGAIPGYQDWLNGMKDPSAFYNNLMKNYQESPQAQYLQQQAMRGGMNAASASGMAGSTPFAQQMAQTSEGISQNDMNNWLNNVLGINSQYGQGLGKEVGWGQGAANQQTNLYNQMGQAAGGAAYGQQAGQNFDNSNIAGGLFGGLSNWWNQI